MPLAVARARRHHQKKVLVERQWSLLEAVSQRLADQVIVTNDNPRSEDPRQIVAEILSGMADRKGVHVELDRAKAIQVSIAAAATHDGMVIQGMGRAGLMEGGTVHSHDDHRIAMAMAVAALAAGPLSIDDPTVVAKSFPDFWSTWRVMLASSDFGAAP